MADEAVPDDEDSATRDTTHAAEHARDRLDHRPGGVVDAVGEIDPAVRACSLGEPAGNDRRLGERCAEGLVTRPAVVAVAARRVVHERDATPVRQAGDDFVPEDDAIEPAHPELLDVGAAEAARDDLHRLAAAAGLGDVGEHGDPVGVEDDRTHGRIVGARAGARCRSRARVVLVTLAGDARQFARYLWDLRGYLRTPLTIDGAIAELRTGLADREPRFLQTLDTGVWSDSRSLYGALFRHAGIERADVARLLGDEGLESALVRLDDAGVRLTVDELRGRMPIVRDGVELDTRGLGVIRTTGSVAYTARTGGSRSGGVPVSVDLRRPEAHGVQSAALYRSFARGRPRIALWFPAPPSVAGLSSVLSHAKIGLRIERWFSQTDWYRGALRDVGLTAGTLGVSRTTRLPFPRPRTTGPDDARTIATWLARATAVGDQAVLITTPSAGVRVTAAATDEGLDLEGCLFRLHGEPLTDARRAAIEAVGVRTAGGYFVAEAGGGLALACATRREPDDLHVLLDRVALTSPQERSGEPCYLAATTIDPRASAPLVNLHLGDVGVLERRTCGCTFGELGFDLHVHSISSPEKLTSEGMTIAAPDVLELLEVMLPSRFGGTASDYQLAERDDGGVTRIALVISPRVGGVDEDAVRETLQAFFGGADRGRRLIGEVWAATGTVRIERREPFVTVGGKTPPVHAVPRD